MTETALLDRLADDVGIQPSFHDVWGNRVAVSAATKQALLTAMGFDVSDDRAIAASLEAWQNRGWARVVPPVVVLDEGASAPSVVVSVPAGGSITWTLRAESGAVQSGSVAAEALALLQSRRDLEQRALPLPTGLPLGYHALSVVCGDRQGSCRVIVAPSRCLTVPEVMHGHRAWGITTQVYSLASSRNWGMGDFTDLAQFCAAAGAEGAQAVGVNPLHALYVNEPRHLSPYDPSSRVFVNTLYIDPQAIAEYQDSAAAQAIVASEAFKAALAEARSGEIVNYWAVGKLKYPVLEAIYGAFCATHDAAAPRARAFAQFRAEQGAALENQCLFDALHEKFYVTDGGPFCWWDWPEAFRRADSPAVAAFASAHAERIRYFAWLQWVADEQLAGVAAACQGAGMRIGLYRDVAVAVNAAGAEAWAGGKRMGQGAAVGAPPDFFSPKGQNWGLKPFNPVGLIDSAYEPFIAAVRANMRHAGAMRIDHAMWLYRLYWVPDGMSAAEGAYVHYPFQDLLRIVALESRRTGSVVIAEDLGTVPEGFSPALTAAGVLSYKVLWFERSEQDGGFFAPEHYAPQALACISTHDLPSLAGFWAGRDIEMRDTLNLFKDAGQADRERADRRKDKGRLADSMIAAGVLADDQRNVADSVQVTEAFVAAAHAYIAKTPCAMIMVQVEDMLGIVDQVNLPGTTEQHPNWRQRLPLDVAAIFHQPMVRRVAATVRATL
jgi:4-alpha-glucanotransferase